MACDTRVTSESGGAENMGHSGNARMKSGAEAAVAVVTACLVQNPGVCIVGEPHGLI